MKRSFIALSFLAAPPAFAADPVALKQSAWSYIDSEAKTLAATNHKIWGYAEPSLEEYKSSKELQDLLRKNGFKVEAGVSHMPTAFVATYGEGAPVIGILAEFDALLGITQSDKPVADPVPGAAAGHACGHSAFGAGSTGAALAIKKLIASGAIKGTVKLYGTPAEETGIGKVYMLRDGHFKSDDVILHWHPSSVTIASYGSSKAIINFKVRFTGQQAHASAQPYAGRSALDAVELTSVGTQYMREHVRQDARIHSVITNGGGQPNVVPAEAEAWYYIRADKFSDVAEYFKWFQQIAAGAAMMTQTKLEPIEILSEIHETIPVRALSEATYKNLTTVGIPKWDEKDLAFAASTQREFKDPFGFDYTKAGIAMSPKIEPLADIPRKGDSSTDVGDISWFVPTVGFMVATYGYGLPTHSWPVAAAAGSPLGDKALVVAAKVIAATAIDLYTDPDLMTRTKKEFTNTKFALIWQTLIPEGQNAPASVRSK